MTRRFLLLGTFFSFDWTMKIRTFGGVGSKVMPKILSLDYFRNSVEFRKFCEIFECEFLVWKTRIPDETFHFRFSCLELGNSSLENSKTK